MQNKRKLIQLILIYFGEMVKFKVSEESLKYGTSKKKKLENKGEEIEQAIATLEKRLPELNGDETRRKQVWSDLEAKKR